MQTQIIKNPIDFDLIQLRKFHNRKLIKNIKKNIFALDTETLDGSVKLIADNTGRYLLNPIGINDLLEFLTYDKYRASIQFFFNINYDANAIIKAMPRENMVDLHETGKTEIDDCEIFYIPRKLLRITKNKNVYAFYDLFQYYETSLERASRQFLNQEKYTNPINTKILGSSMQYWNDNLEMIIDYCIHDCELTQQLGIILQNTLSDCIGLYPDSYISKAGLTKQYVRKSCNVPDILYVPNNALRYAFNSYSGGRFEIIKKGFVGDCSLFDITSAYPFYIRDLIDISNGTWYETESMHESCDYGFYLVKLQTKYRKITPLPYTLPNDCICYPVMDCLMYCTKHELLAFENYIDYEIIDGWEFYANKIIYPFREYVDSIFERKSQTEKTDYKYNLYKILLNSLYGCFYEKIPSRKNEMILAGKLFNPIYATMITSQTRIQAFEFAIPFESDVVGFATDSVLFQGKPDLPNNKKLGEWAIETTGKTTVLRTGIYQIDDKIKSRGIKKATNIITPDKNEYTDLFHYIKSEPNKTIYPVVINRPLSFIECLLHHNKHTLNDINKFIDMDYNIDINTDYKRIWNGEFNCGIELFSKCIDSNPLIIG